jgi:hypothetical protein
VCKEQLRPQSCKLPFRSFWAFYNVAQQPHTPAIYFSRPSEGDLEQACSLWRRRCPERSLCKRDFSFCDPTGASCELKAFGPFEYEILFGGQLRSEGLFRCDIRSQGVEK